MASPKEHNHWTFSHSIVPEGPSVGIFFHNSLTYEVKLGPSEQNWLMTNVPSPSHSHLDTGPGR
jgi:hypothetical protein